MNTKKPSPTADFAAVMYSLYFQTEGSQLLFTSYDLSHWHNIFSKWDSIILHDIEEICDNYPAEYALLKKQNLQDITTTRRFTKCPLIYLFCL